MNKQNAYLAILNNIPHLKNAASTDYELEYVSITADTLLKITMSAQDEINESGIDIPLSEVVISPLVVGERSPVGDVAGKIIESIYTYIDSSCASAPLLALNRKILIAACAAYTNCSKFHVENIKQKTHSLFDVYISDEYKAECILIVCKCHYFRSDDNWMNFTFWEYATAWVNSEIKPEWAELLKKYFGHSLKPTSLTLEKGKTAK